jgi:hypothetical protein
MQCTKIPAIWRASCFFPWSLSDDVRIGQADDLPCLPAVIAVHLRADRPKTIAR